MNSSKLRGMTRISGRTICITTTAFAGITAPICGAFAQSPENVSQSAEEAGSGSSPIVVTATRREASLQDTPLAVGVTTGEMLTRDSISSFQDLTRIQPGIVVNNQGAAGNQFIIRGILSDIGATTGFYLDEVPLVGGGALEESGDGKPGLRLHDIERIEVLKGPQGTLFGAGSLAGTLRIIVNRPSLGEIEAGGGLSVGFVDGGHSVQQGDAFFNLPLSGNIAVRATGWAEFGGGYVDQLTGRARNFSLRNVNDREVIGGRFQMLFEPTSDFSILAAVTHQRIEVDGTQAWTLSERPYIATTRSQEPYWDRYTQLSVTAEYETGAGTFSAIGSYGDQYGRMVADSTFTGDILAGIANRIFCPGGVGIFPGLTCPVDAGVISYVNTQNFHDYTGELRFSSDFDGPIQIVVGGYYERDVTNALATAPRADSSTGAVPCYDIVECSALNLRTNIPFAVQTRRVVDQWAAYGQVDWDITDSLTASAGIRYYTADILNRTQSLQGFVTGVVNIVDTPAVPEVREANEDSPSYAFSLLYEINPDVSLYARAASGFRIGGTNGSVDIAADLGIVVPESYGSDSLWSYELGGKAYVFDRSVYTELTVYQMNWSNQQINATDLTGSFDYVVNAGRTRIRGFEFAASYQSDFVTLGGGIAFTDAQLTRDLPPEVVTGGTIGFDGDRMPRIPRWNISAQGEYHTPFGSGEGYLRSNIAYRSGSNYSFNDLNTYNTRIPAYTLIGASVGWRSGPTDLSVFVENLTNDGERSGLSVKPDATRVYAVTPRTIGIRARFGF